MQRSSGRCDGTRGAGKHRLVALGIFFGVGMFTGTGWAFDVGRQGHHAVFFHQSVRLVTQLQVKKLAVLVGPAAQQHGIKSAVAGATGHEHLAADQGFFTHLHVRHHLMAWQHALNEQLEFAARGLFAKNARLDNLGVV